MSNALCDGFTLFVMLDVVGVVTELVEGDGDFTLPIIATYNKAQLA